MSCVPAYNIRRGSVLNRPGFRPSHDVFRHHDLDDVMEGFVLALQAVFAGLQVVPQAQIDSVQVGVDEFSDAGVVEWVAIHGVKKDVPGW